MFCWKQYIYYLCGRKQQTIKYKIMKKEITIIFADDHLRNDQAQIVANFGEVVFNRGSVRIERHGYDKGFLDYVLYCNDICGGYNTGKTFVNIPDNKIISISINEK